MRTSQRDSPDLDDTETKMDVIATNSATEPLLCEICNDRSRLYKCPRCSVFTCSLKCCKLHKTKTQCNGIRDRAEFVSCRDFKESNLKSDYHFLEDVLQTKERAKRTLAQSEGTGSKAPPKKRTKDAAAVPLILNDTYQRLDSYPKGVKNLFNAAKERDTKLILMPNGMTKRTLNKSSFHVKENTIYWKVFVVFITSASFSPEALFRVDLESSKSAQQLTFTQDALVGASLESISEKKSPNEIFEHFMKPTVENASHRHALRALRLNKNNIRCLMHRIPSPNNRPVFIEVDMNKTMKEVLAGQTIIEYPTLYFGSYEHTDRLNVLIGAPDEVNAAEEDAENSTARSSAGGALNQRRIAVVSSAPVSMQEAEEGEIVDSAAMEVEVEAEVQGLQLRSPKVVTFANTDERNSSAGVVGSSSGSGKTQSFSRDLLCLEYGSDEDEAPAKSVSDVVPIIAEGSSTGASAASAVGGRINSSNVADIVGNMKKLIDGTLGPVIKAVEAHARPFPAAVSHTGTITSSSGQMDVEGSDSSDSDTEIGEEDPEDQSFGTAAAAKVGPGEDFLAALRDMADKDIEHLRAFIAAAEAEGEGGDGEESGDDTSDSED